MIDHDKIRKEMNKGLSNVAFNVRTRQFGIILWKRDNTAKISGCGTWGDEEYQILTIGQAMNLIDFNHNNSSWNAPTKECITAVFGDEVITNDLVILKFEEDEFLLEDLGMSGIVLHSPFADLENDWRTKERFRILGFIASSPDSAIIKRELGKRIVVIPKKHLIRFEK